MAKGVFRKHLSHLIPADADAENLMRPIKHGEDVMVEVKRPRNLRHHRLFWGLMGLIWQNQEYYRSPEHVCAAFKIAVGHIDVIKTKRGEVAIPKSISFAKMDQVEFNHFFERALEFAVSEVIPGLGKEDLRTEVQMMVS